MDEEPEEKAPVLRLETEKHQHRVHPVPHVRIELPPEGTEVHQRLETNSREIFETRSHQPGIEALIESGTIQTDSTEQEWGKTSFLQKNVPWGWFILVGIILSSAVIWSLLGVKKSDVQADQIRVSTESVLGKDAREDLEANQLIVKIDEATRKFFSTTDIDALSRLVRHPERVRPLMNRYYADKSLSAKVIQRTKLLQPLVLDNRANFWMAAVELTNNETHNLLIETTDAGEPLIDWETLVCYQPMKWDTFAKERPTGVSLDFRLYIEEDNFFSHEFTDSNHWNCFRLTALNSEETLFGYAQANEETAKSIRELLMKNQGRKVTLVLRITIPEGLQSRRGVVIEKLLSPRWLYIESPNPSS